MADSLKRRTCTYTRKYQPVCSLNLDDAPPPPHTAAAYIQDPAAQVKVIPSALLHAVVRGVGPLSVPQHLIPLHPQQIWALDGTRAARKWHTGGPGTWWCPQRVTGVGSTALTSQNDGTPSSGVTQCRPSADPNRCGHPDISWAFVATRLKGGSSWGSSCKFCATQRGPPRAVARGSALGALPRRGRGSLPTPTTTTRHLSLLAKRCLTVFF